MSKLLRNGRLAKARKDVVKFTSSSNDDRRILKHIININKAHTIMLAENSIIDLEDGKKILKTLDNLDSGIDLTSDTEDGHMAVEEAVVESAVTTGADRAAEAAVHAVPDLSQSAVENIARERGILPDDFSWSREYITYAPSLFSVHGSAPIYKEKLTMEEIIQLAMIWVHEFKRYSIRNRIIDSLKGIKSFSDLQNLLTFIKVYFKQLLKPNVFL